MSCYVMFIKVLLLHNDILLPVLITSFKFTNMNNPPLIFNSSFKELLSFKFTHRHISVSLLVYIFTKKNLHKKL